MIALALEPGTGAIDLSRTDAGRLALEEGLETAVLVSLFTDRRAGPDDGLEQGERRGWWGDAYAEDRSQLGSRLWLLRRAGGGRTSTLRRAEEYAREALAWLVEDGLAEAVTASAEWSATDRLSLSIQIRRPDAASPLWQRLWEVHLGV